MNEDDGCKHGHTAPCTLCQQERHQEALAGSLARAELDRELLVRFARSAVALDDWLTTHDNVPDGFNIANAVYLPFVEAKNAVDDAGLLDAPAQPVTSERDPWKVQVPKADELSADLHDRQVMHRTLTQAEYWRNGARASSSRSEQWIAHDQAVNAWKNLAFSLSVLLKPKPLAQIVEDAARAIEANPGGHERRVVLAAGAALVSALVQVDRALLRDPHVIPADESDGEEIMRQARLRQR